MTASILFATNSPAYSEKLVSLCRQLRPDVKAFLPGEAGAEQVQVAACWSPEQTLLKDYPNIKLIHSTAAGVDHLGGALLASGLPICRVVDDGQKLGMFEYILCGILQVQRNFDKAVQEQLAQHWQRYPMRTKNEIRVGILGLGELGGYVASKLAEFGYSVSGWSRSEKKLASVSCHYGGEGLAEVVSQADVLVNMLPLNPHTKGILSANVFRQLPQGAYLINCGRGDHLVSDDLIQSIENGHLRGALLDVFSVEPLPSSDPLWKTQGVLITPHVASDASKPEIIQQLADNAIRCAKGEPLKNQIDPVLGY